MKRENLDEAAGDDEGAQAKRMKTEEAAASIKQDERKGTISPSEAKVPTASGDDESEKPSVAKAEPGSKTDKIPYQEILKSKNRHRLPDKIMRCLYEGIEPEVLWWSPHENGFTVDADTVQEKLLDVHFRGTKLSSLVRSLNRWGFRRDFYRTLPKKALAFLHPQFQKDKPHLLKEMKICTSTSQIVDSSDDEEEEEAPKTRSGKAGSGRGGNGDGRKPPAAPPATRASFPNTMNATQQTPSALLAGTTIMGAQDGTAGLGWQQRALADAGLLNPQTQQSPALSGSFLNPQLSLLQAELRRPNALSLSSPFLQQGSGRQEAALLQQLIQQQQQQQQHQLQQDQLSAFLQAAVRGPETNPAAAQNRQLADLLLGRQREEAVRALQLSQLRTNPDQLLASLSSQGLLSHQNQLQPAGASQQNLGRNIGQSSEGDGGRDHLNSQVLAMVQLQSQPLGAAQPRSRPPDP